MIKEKDIKNWIRRHFNLHGNQKIILANNQSFIIRIGDCDSIEVEFPKSLKRHLLLDSILD